MKFDARALAARLKELLAGFTTGQKVMTVLAVVALAIGGIFISSWEGTATYAPLFSNLSAADAQSVISQLQTQKEPYKISENGTAVLVPEADVYKLRISLSAAGLPSNGDSGYALLDKEGLTTSDFQQHVDYQRALEGELAKTIGAIDGVQSASVHLVIPNTDVFADDSSKASASVLIRTNGGVTLSSDTVQAVVHLVSSSVDNLSPDDITVADASGHVLSAPGVDTAAAGTARSEQTSAYDTAESQQLQALVDQVVGTGHSAVQVSADLNLDQTATHSQTYVQTPGVGPISSSTTKETYKGTGGVGSGTVSGVLGPDNNGQSTTSTTTSGNGTYAKTDTTVQNSLGTVDTQTTSVPGAVSRLSVAVLLDSSGKVATPANIAKIKQIVSAAAGVNAARGDTVQVTALPFSAAAAPAVKAAPAAGSQLNLIKTAGLGGLLLLLFVAALLGTRRTTRTPVLLPLREAEPAALEAGEQPLALGAGAAALEAPDASLALPAAQNRQTLDEQLNGIIARQPDDLAHLLRDWLAERSS